MYKNFVTFSFIFGYKNKRNRKNVCHTYSCTSYTIGPGLAYNNEIVRKTTGLRANCIDKTPAFCFLP